MCIEYLRNLVSRTESQTCCFSLKWGFIYNVSCDKLRLALPISTRPRNLLNFSCVWWTWPFQPFSGLHSIHHYVSTSSLSTRPLTFKCALSAYVQATLAIHLHRFRFKRIVFHCQSSDRCTSHSWRQLYSYRRSTSVRFYWSTCSTILYNLHSRTAQSRSFWTCTVKLGV